MAEKKKDNKEKKNFAYGGFEQKPKANTGCLRGILYFLCIISVSLFLSIFGWNCVNDVLALTKPDKPVEITIAEDFNIRELSRELAELGVINHAWLFNLFGSYSSAEDKIEPGTYIINSNLDYNAIVKSFINIPLREEVRVSIPEGLTLAETLALIADSGVSSFENLIRARTPGGIYVPRHI
jgi:UPF0755 protein